MKFLKSVFFTLALLLFLANQIKGQYTGGVGLGPAPGGSFASAKIALNSGKISNLKDLKAVNIIYSYAGMGVNTFRTEEEFFKEIKNFNKKSSSLVGLFSKNWFAYREQKYEPAFEKMFNLVGEEVDFSGKNYSTDADITLKVETVHTDIYYKTDLPDFIESKYQNQPATSLIDIQFTFIDKSGEKLATFFVKNVTEKKQKADFISPDSEGLTKNYEQAAYVLIKELAKRIKHKKIKPFSRQRRR